MRENIIIAVFVAAIAGVLAWGSVQSKAREELIALELSRFRERRVEVTDSAESRTFTLVKELPELKRQLGAAEDEIVRTQEAIRREEERKAQLAGALEAQRGEVKAAGDAVKAAQAGLEKTKARAGAVREGLKSGKPPQVQLAGEFGELLKKLKATADKTSTEASALRGLEEEAEKLRADRERKKELKAKLREVERQVVEKGLAGGDVAPVRVLFSAHASGVYGPAVLYRLGVLLHGQGLFEEAVSTYSDLVKRYPGCKDYVEKAGRAEAAARSQQPVPEAGAAALVPCEPQG